MLIKHLRNIVSLNERFAYNLLGLIRKLILPIFNSFLESQEKKIRKKLKENSIEIRDNLSKIIPKIYAKDLDEILSEEKKQYIISIANKAVKQEFDILSTKVKFENEIDWHIDFNSGFKWPKGKLYIKYNQVDESNNADVKFPRELSRCHHFLYLGQAYLLTNNEKYTKAFINQIEHWILDNPYKKSINWGCSMDIAIRAVNWIYALNMFSESKSITDSSFNMIITSLYLHGRYIYENPEKNRVYNHNHYLSDLCGQIIISLLFDNLNNEEVKGWKSNGIYEFYREIRLQILPSGFTYERTTNYHRLVTELIAYTIIFLLQNDIEVPQDILLRVKKMFECIKYYLFKDGTAPIIGDQDSGRFLPFFPYETNYQNYLLSVSSYLFTDGFKDHNLTTVDTLFLFGKSEFDKMSSGSNSIKKYDSVSFPDAGFYIMKSEDVYVFINNSGLSHYNENKAGTHTHSDLLSFVYEYKGIPFLIDPGSYVYSSNPAERMKFRSTAMHNTLTVDDLDQNSLRVNDLWSIERNAIPKEIIWISNDNEDIYEGLHTGYQRLVDPVIHQRKFLLDKKDKILSIFDSIKCKSEHSIKLHFHFDDKVDVEILNKKRLKLKKDNIKLEMKFELDNSFDLKLQQEYISKSYNSKQLAPYVEMSMNICEDINILTKIMQWND